MEVLGEEAVPVLADLQVALDQPQPLSLGLPLQEGHDELVLLHALVAFNARLLGQEVELGQDLAGELLVGEGVS